MNDASECVMSRTRGQIGSWLISRMAIGVIHVLAIRHSISGRLVQCDDQEQMRRGDAFGLEHAEA
jgi:hypothetical protein